MATATSVVNDNGRSAKQVSPTRPCTHPSFPHDKVAHHVSALLALFGEDPHREGLRDTPGRVARAWESLLAGDEDDEAEVLAAIFEHSEAASGHDLVLVQDVEFTSLCEHHMLPMRGKCHVAYIPDQHILGLSKIPRLVDVYAQRLQVQERITAQVADALMEHLKPKGVLVITQAVHFCMIMRGVEKQCSHTTCATARGVFQENSHLELKVQGYLQTGFTPHGRG